MKQVHEKVRRLNQFETGLNEFGAAQPFFTPGSAANDSCGPTLIQKPNFYRNAHFSLLNLISSAEIKIDV